jgi:hypothetical protein
MSQSMTFDCSAATATSSPSLADAVSTSVQQGQTPSFSLGYESSNASAPPSTTNPYSCGLFPSITRTLTGSSSITRPHTLNRASVIDIVQEALTITSEMDMDDFFNDENQSGS